MLWVPEVGERVRIRAEEFLDGIGPGLNSAMIEWAGEVVTIKEIKKRPQYPGGYEICLVEHSYTWILEWFEPIKYPPGTCNLAKN